MELFISYGRDPVVTKFVHKLKTDLESVGFSVWMDTHDIPAGSDWHGAIGAGLSNCKAILPVITSKYLGSRYCVNELYTADSDKKLIFPIMLENVDFDAAEYGHGVKFTTSGVNWTMCRLGTDDYNKSMSSLISAMKAKGLGGGLGGGEGGETETKSFTQVSSAPTFKPLIGPSSTMPFKVIPDVENPEGITALPDGGLAVSIVRQKVLIFNSDHEKILELGGEPGLGMGQFLSPTGVAVDGEGNLLVVCHYFLQKFSPSGKCLQQVGGPTGPFSIDAPRGLAVGKDNRVYITEQQKHRVTVLNSDLSLYKRFSDADRMLGSGHLNLPQGLAINSDGEVYVADMMNHVVQVFDSEGTFLFRFGGMGHGPGTTTSLTSVAIDPEDYVYVGCATGTISIFSREGKFVRAFGEHGIEIGKFNTIRALHLDTKGVLYVGEWTSNRIQMFRTRDSAAVATGTGSAAAEVDRVTSQTEELTLDQSSPLQQLPSAKLNITGGRGMTVIGGSVTIGRGVVFSSHVAIQPGSNIVAQHGTTSVPIPVAVPAAPTGGRGQVSGGVEAGGVVFAKAASNPCNQAGVREPLPVLETEEPVVSMAASGTGHLVVSGKNLTLYDSQHKKLCQSTDRQLSGAHVAFEDKETMTIVAVTYQCIAKLDAELKVVSKVEPHRAKTSDLAQLTAPFALVIGKQGQLYIVGSKKCHIVNPDLTHCKTFAEGSGQAFAIAVGKSGNVYVPTNKTLCVFSADGDSLFQFGGPGRPPLPHLSLVGPMSLALDLHDNVYVGIGMQSVVKFDRDGKFVEQFLSRVNFEAIPKPMCTDPGKQYLFVGIHGKNKIQVYTLPQTE